MKSLMIIILVLTLWITAIEAGLSASNIVKKETDTTQINSKLSPVEKTFVSETVQINLFEIKAGELASKKSKNSHIKALAERMVSEHSKANSELKQIAELLSIKVTEVLGAEHQQKYKALSSAKEKEFDELYVKEMVSAHQTAVRTLMKESIIGSHELREYAETYLPKVKAHRTEFKQLRKQLSKV